MAVTCISVQAWKLGRWILDGRTGRSELLRGWLSWIWPVKSVKPFPGAGLGLRLQTSERSRWSAFRDPGLVSASLWPSPVGLSELRRR